MNNPKIFRKVLGIVLVLAMLVGAFAAFAVGSSAAEEDGLTFSSSSSAVAELISANGITFDDFTGKTGELNAANVYLRDYKGLYITAQKENTGRAGMSMKKQADGDYAINFNGSAYFINGNINDAKSEGKYDLNSMLLDLLYNPDGPQNFQISMDWTVNGTSGASNSIAKTSDNNSKNNSYLSTYYRGVSALTLNNAWLFKITSANIPAYTVKDGVADLADSIPDDMKDKGYIYPNSGTATLKSTGNDELSKYSSLNGGKTDWATCGKTDNCISEEMMDMDGVGDALTYKLNEPFTVTLDVTRFDNGKGIKVTTYITTSYKAKTQVAYTEISCSSNDWKYGIRFFDSNVNVDIDNIKVTAPNNDFGDIHTGAWADFTRTIIEDETVGNGIAVVDVCNRCGEIIKTYPKVAYDGVDSVWVRGSSGSPSATTPSATKPAEADIKRLYFENISGSWATLKTAPFWINFDMTDITALATNDNSGKGRSLLTWLDKSDGYSQLFRLFANGEIRLINSSGQYVAKPNAMKLTTGGKGYSFHIRVNPFTGRYDVYVDNLDDAAGLQYFGSEAVYKLRDTQAFASGYPQIRFNDEDTAAFRIENFNITVESDAANHVHTYEPKVEVGYDTLVASEFCYCGAEKTGAAVAVNAEALVKTDSVYYGTGSVAGIPTTGEFWIATDYNVRTADALTNATNVMSIGGQSIAVDGDKLTAPGTYQYAVKVTYIDTKADLDIFLDGELVETRENVTLTDAATLTLGDTGATTKDIRFNATKVVTLGATETPVAVTYNETADTTLLPCVHTGRVSNLHTDADGNLFRTIECELCGEIVYNEPLVNYHNDNVNGTTDGKIEVSSNKFDFYYLPADCIGANSLPYQFSFTMTVDEMLAADKVANLYNKGMGRNVLNFDGLYNSILRVFPIPDGNGNYLADKVELRSCIATNNAPYLATLSKGDEIDVDLYVNPVKGTVDIYIDGVYMLTRTIAEGDNKGYASDKAKIRFGDGATCKFTYSNFTLVRSHVHDSTWSGDQGKKVFMTDTAFRYYYKCYCGLDVCEDDITKIVAPTKDVYFGSAEFTSLPTSGSFWVVTEYNARTAEALANAVDVMNIGGTAIAVDSAMTAPSTYQYAVKVTYTGENKADLEIYVNGALTEHKKDVTLTGATVALGDAGVDTDDIRFNNTRIIETGFINPVAFEYEVNESVKPCYHEEKLGTAKFAQYDNVTLPGSNVGGINKLVYIYDCAKCGEKVYLAQGDVLGLVGDKTPLAMDEHGNALVVHSNASFIYLKPEDIMTGAGAYWLSFDIKGEFTEAQVKSIADKASGGSSIMAFRFPHLNPPEGVDPSTSEYKDYWGKSGRTDYYSYIHTMRAYAAYEADGTTKRTDAIGIKFTQTDSGIAPFVMENGKTYNVSFLIDPTDKGVNYKAYLDGVFMFEKTDSASLTLDVLNPEREDLQLTKDKGRYFHIRIPGGSFGNYTITNFSLVRAVEEQAHVCAKPTDAWVTANDFTVVATDKALEKYFTCYCGEKVLVEEISTIIENDLKNVYKDAPLSIAAPATPYWFATELNLRSDSDESVAGGTISFNGVSVETADGKLLVNGVDTGIEVAAPNTYVIAVQIGNGGYNLYVDGNLVVNGICSEGNSIELSVVGDARFNNNKLVELGETKTTESLTYKADITKRPCAHKAPEIISSLGINEAGTLVCTYKCTECGEIVYGAPVEDSNTFTGTYPHKITGAGNLINYNLPADFIGKDAEPYQLDVTLKFTKLMAMLQGGIGSLANDYDEDKKSENYGKPRGYNSGRNVINSDGKYNALVRQFPAYDENGNIYTDRIELRSRNDKDNFHLGTVMLDEEFTISLRVYPATNKVDIYINGEYAGTRTDAYENSKTKFRIGDGATCTFEVSDIKLMRLVDTHVHSDNWLTAEEAAATTMTVNNGTIAYTYPCYCGNTVTYGIKEVKVDSTVAPEYGLAESKTVLTGAALKGNALVGSVAVNTIPTAETAIVKLGDTDLIILDENGVVAVAGNKTDITFAADSKYHTFAVYFGELATQAYVYIDGKYVRSIDCADTADLTVGSDNGVYHFDSITVAALAEGSNLEYEVASHTHTFDPFTAELQFNEERTTITIEYVCTACDRPAVDGIVTNLCRDKSIPTVLGTGSSSVVILENVQDYVDGLESYWFSADFAVAEAIKKNFQPIVSIADNAIMFIDYDGSIRLNDGNGTVFTTIGREEVFNISFCVVPGDETASVYVYYNGKYCVDYEVALGADYDIKVGVDNGPSFNITNAKLAQMGNGGKIAIGAYSCDFHEFDYKNATIGYINLDTFTVSRKCLVCGLTITEKPVYNNYTDDITHIYGGHGNVDAAKNTANWPAELEDLYHGYFMVVDVNLRDTAIGKFDGYKNLVGKTGESLVLINSNGQLMLGDGKVTTVTLTGKNIYNIAVEVEDADPKFFVVYVDGAYVGKANFADIKYTYEYADTESYEEFGAEGLENIRFYNIRSFLQCAKGTAITFGYKEDTTVVPCPHIVDNAVGDKTILFGDPIQVVFICGDCGERAYLTFDENLYDATLNNASDKLVLDSNNSATVKGTTYLYAPVDIHTTSGNPFWLRFNVKPTALNVDSLANAKLEGKPRTNGGNFISFGGNHVNVLRLFVPYTGADYYDVRSYSSATAAKVGEFHVDEEYEIALYVDPASKRVDIYFDGEYKTTRTSAVGNDDTIRFLDGAWGDFEITNFQFVTSEGAKHVHTAKYSSALGVEPTLACGDTTLTFTYMCNCGETIVEGIDNVYADAIIDIKGVTTAKEISEATLFVTDSTPYWVSAKVYGDGSDATVYSYKSTALVSVAGGFYKIGDTATTIAPAGKTTAGDFDIVAIKVDSVNDVVDVYINGYLAGTCTVDLTAGEAFAITLGGGAKLDFRNIKVVSLAEGKKGTVTLAQCVQHEFDYIAAITAEVVKNGTDVTGINYKCKNCGAVLREVKIDDPANAANKGYVEKGADVSDNKNTSVYHPASSFAPFDKYMTGDTDTIWYTFDMKGLDFAKLDTGGKSLLTWATDLDNNGGLNEKDSFLQFFRVFKESETTAELKLRQGNGASDYVSTSPKTTLVKDKVYNVAIEIEFSKHETKADKLNLNYHVYINGTYIGTGYFEFTASTTEKPVRYKIRFGDSDTGSWSMTGITLFNPYVDAPAANIPEIGGGEDTTLVDAPHSHMPDDATKATALTLNDDGTITMKFDCACGVKNIELTVMNNVLPEDEIVTDFNNVNNTKHIPLNGAVGYGTGTYVISLDFSVNSVSFTDYDKAGGYAVLSVEGPNNARYNLARAYPHAYVDGEGYTDVDNDGYADNVIDLRVYDSKSAPLIATIGAGEEAVNITYVIHPSDNVKDGNIDNSDSQFQVYVNGTYVTTYSGFKPYSDSLRFVDGSGGIKKNYNFNNIKIVRLSDEHKPGACAPDTYTSACTCGCGKTVEAAHNYVATVDKTGMWTKYTCDTCQTYYVVFNDMSLVSKLTFASDYELMKYLTDTYFPIF